MSTENFLSLHKNINTLTQLSGRKNPKSIDGYVVTSHAQQREMSKTWVELPLNTTTTPNSSTVDAPFTKEMHTQALISGAYICVINI